MSVGVTIGSTIPNSNERIHFEEKKNARDGAPQGVLTTNLTNKHNLNQPNN